MLSYSSVFLISFRTISSYSTENKYFSAIRALIFFSYYQRDENLEYEGSDKHSIVLKFWAFRKSVQSTSATSNFSDRRQAKIYFLEILLKIFRVSIARPAQKNSLQLRPKFLISSQPSQKQCFWHHVFVKFGVLFQILAEAEKNNMRLKKTLQYKGPLTLMPSMRFIPNSINIKLILVKLHLY